MPNAGWTRIGDGEMPIGWVLIAVRWNAGCPPSILRAYWDKWEPEPRWHVEGYGELPAGATVRGWHPLPELPEWM